MKKWTMLQFCIVCSFTEFTKLHCLSATGKFAFSYVLSSPARLISFPLKKEEDTVHKFILLEQDTRTYFTVFVLLRKKKELPSTRNKIQ